MENNKNQTRLLYKVAICLALILLIFLVMQGKMHSSVVMAANETEITNIQEERCYLSDIAYMKEQSSVASGHSIKLDKNDSDKILNLKVNGKSQVFIKGICAWASSQVVYDLSKYNYDYFTSYIGIDSSEQSNYFNTGVKFYIYTSNDATNWEKKFESETMYGWSDAESVKINVKGTKYLKLTADNNSPNWWAEWYDEAIYADAKLIKENYEEDTSSTVDFIKTLDEYDEIIKKHEGEEIKGDYELALLQRELVKNADYNTLQAFVRCDSSYKETVKWLMTDLDNLRLYILGGEPDGNYVSSLQALTKLYTKHKEDLDIKETTKHGTVLGDLYKKMMITLSLTHSAQVALWMDTTSPENQSDPVTRYEIYKDLHAKGKFVVSSRQDHTPWFEDLKVEEMRYVLNNIIDDEEILWLNEYTQKYIDQNPNKEEEYLQPHHYMKYIWPDYSRPEYHDLAKKDEWNEKYDFLRYGVTYRPGVVKLWMNIEGGAVCGGISKIGSNIRGVHGTPSSVISQPGHAALIYYRKDKDNNGYWTIDNDVSGWAQSGKTEKLSVRMPLGWGNDSYVEGWAATYIVLAQEALNHYEQYEESTKNILLANSYEGNPTKQEELYRKAIEIQPYNIDAWYGLIKLYEEDETKTEKDYYYLAEQIGANLKCFPLPMYNLTNLIKNHLTSIEYTFKFTLLQTRILTEGSNLDKDSKLVYQPSITRTVATYLLGEMDKELATFSFDGEDAGKIVLSSRYDNSGIRWDYTLNGKSTNKKDWIEVDYSADQEHKLTLTQEQINSITAENDIYVHIVGTGYEDANLYKIDITDQQNPELYANDLENRVVGVDLNSEWRYKDSEEWTSYLTASPDLTGNKSVEIRQPASSTMLASKPVTYNFTQDNQEITRRYVPVSHLSIEKVSTEEPGHNGAASNAIDGNYNTRYHSNWNGQDTERYIVIKVDKPIYLSAVEFVPAGGGNGKIVDGTIYGSMDGETWEELDKEEGLTYDKNVNDYDFGINNIKTFEIANSKEIQYIKIVADKTNGNWFAARMFNIYEDLEKNPHITAGIAFSTINKTNQNVEARLVNPSVDIEITNNGGKDTFEFKDNGTFTFEFTDKATHTKKGTAEARVDWIDREAPTATIKYSTQKATFDEVVAELIPSEDVRVTNINNFEYNEEEGRKVYTYTFKKNGTFTFEFQDIAGNTGKATAQVYWIKSTTGHPDLNNPNLPEDPGIEDPTPPDNPEIDNPNKPEDPGIEDPGTTEEIKSDKYVIKDGYISQIAPKTSYSEFLQNVKTDKDIFLIDKEGKTITQENTKLVTGMTVKIGSESEYVILITGDINEDGRADFQDILQINKHRLNKKKLDGMNLLAGDVNKDGKVDFQDILRINKYRLGKTDNL